MDAAGPRADVKVWWWQLPPDRARRQASGCAAALSSMPAPLDAGTRGLVHGLPPRETRRPPPACRRTSACGLRTGGPRRAAAATQPGGHPVDDTSGCHLPGQETTHRHHRGETGASNHACRFGVARRLRRDGWWRSSTAGSPSRQGPGTRSAGSLAAHGRVGWQVRPQRHRHPGPRHNAPRDGARPPGHQALRTAISTRMPARPAEYALNCGNNSLTPFAPGLGSGYVILFFISP